jgi:hypothetical protein
MAAIASSYQYAVLGSMGIVTWLFTQNTATMNKVLLSNVVWLPFVLSGLLFSLSMAQYLRLGQMGRYFHQIEQSLGAPKLGWENWQRNFPATVLPVFFVGWALLLLVDFFVAVLRFFPV